MQHFKSRLTGRTGKYWRGLLRKGCSEQVLLDAIHDSCAPESLMTKVRELREKDLQQSEKLKFASSYFDQCIKNLNRLVQRLRAVDPVLAPMVFMDASAEAEWAELPEPKPTIFFGQILMELEKYSLLLENYRRLRASEQVNRVPTRLLNKNLALAMVFDFLISCSGEPHWQEVSNIINAAYLAHELDEHMTAANAQKLWSRHGVTRPAKRSDNPAI